MERITAILAELLVFKIENRYLTHAADELLVAREIPLEDLLRLQVRVVHHLTGT